METVSVLILAGGKSERMGLPKPFLLIEGKTFIEKISDAYAAFGLENVFTILNDQFARCVPDKINSYKVIRNPHPEYGRFYSLQEGLKQLPDSDYVFIHNVDNPFIEQKILESIWNKRTPAGFAVPTHKGKGGHPVLIPKKIVTHILSIKSRSHTLREILREYNRAQAEVDSEKILVNINTWEEYEDEVLNLIPEYCSE